MSSNHDLRERIEAVSNASADADELVTVSVPPEESLGDVRERIQEDHASAEYGASDRASTHLTDALEQARRRFNQYDGTPDNGLVLYVGVVDGDLVEYVFDDLPSPVRESTYEYANEFDTEPLEAGASTTAEYGLLVVERGGAALGRLVDDRVETIASFDSDVPGKTRAGGQSAERFERERERQKEEFYQAVAANAGRAFLADRRAADPADVDPAVGSGAAESDADDSDDGEAPETERSPAETEASEANGETDALSGGKGRSIDGLLLGGTTVTVDEFREGEYLDHRLGDAIVDSFAVEYASEQGLRQLARKARDSLAEVERADAGKALDEFFGSLGDDEVVYGRDRTEEALTYDAVDTTLVSEALPTEEVRDLEERTADQGGDCVVVPTDAERGRRFDEAFGGVGAFLRFPID